MTIDQAAVAGPALTAGEKNKASSSGIRDRWKWWGTKRCFDMAGGLPRSANAAHVGLAAARPRRRHRDASRRGILPESTDQIANPALDVRRCDEIASPGCLIRPEDDRKSPARACGDRQTNPYQRPFRWEPDAHRYVSNFRGGLVTRACQCTEGIQARIAETRPRRHAAEPARTSQPAASCEFYPSGRSHVVPTPGTTPVCVEGDNEA